MRITKSWIIAAKDMKVVLRKRYTAYSLVVFPIIIGIGLPIVLFYARVKMANPAGMASHGLLVVMNAFAFFFVIGASVIPTTLASYSMVGEKVEQSLEPLLASPIGDSELLLGKGIGAFIPSLVSLYIGAILFMVLSDLVTHGILGYFFFPNWTVGLILLISMPLMAILSVEWNVIVSARATDPRAAQLQGVLIAIPLMVIYVATEIGALTLNTTTIWAISGVTLILDVILFFLSTGRFHREEILTKWT